MYRKSKRQLQKESLINGWASNLPAGADTRAPSSASTKRLALDVRGTVVLPSDASYNSARQLANNVFQDFPQLIVYCEVIGDVREALAFAKRHGLWVTTRSGGHCTAGFSVNTGIVIDTSRMNYTVVDPKAQRAIVGAGTNFGHLFATLDEWGLHTPAGACLDVCVAGHSAGGGYGFTSRQFGLNCDNVIEAMVMLADGQVVIANAKQNEDLFWAIRGGTGNNFGITLQLTYRLHDLREVWGYGVRWPIEHAPAALVELQSKYMRTGAPKELGYMAVVVEQQGKRWLMMRGVFDGPTAQGKKALESLLRLEGAELDFDERGTFFALNQKLLETPLPVPDCPDLAREDKRSAIIDRDLTLKEWEKIIRAYEKTPNSWSTICIEPYGGAIGARPLDFNAFVHRKASMDLFLDVFWMDDKQQRDAVRFLDQFLTVVDPLSNGHQYQNYPRLGTKHYGKVYWGDAYDRLQRIKRKYDPKNVFHFAQSIQPAKSPGGGKGSALIVENTRGKRGTK
jgi:FAD/FMN-containing dehydrogenase